MKLLLAVIIVGLLIFIYSRGRPDEKKIKIGTTEWTVSARYENAEDASRLVHDVNVAIIEFLRYLKFKYRIDAADDERSGGLREDLAPSADIIAVVDHMLNNYNPEVIKENVPGGRETSYTLNKGEQMMLCLRQVENPDKLVDYDTMLFVVLHELAHIGAYDVWGHPDRFWEVFKFVLTEAASAGIYKPVDYAAKPVRYCGMTIAYNPYFDKTL